MFKLKQDTYSYKGWLLSDSIYKRALAIAGHYVLGFIMLYVAGGIITMIILFIIGLFFW